MFPPDSAMLPIDTQIGPSRLAMHAVGEHCSSTFCGLGAAWRAGCVAVFDSKPMRAPHS